MTQAAAPTPKIFTEEQYLAYDDGTQITVLRWIDGLYEDTVIRGSDCVQSNVVPSLD